MEVDTPKGRGFVWLVTDYGHETDTLYTVVLNATGEMWQFTHRDLRACKNVTFKRDYRPGD